MTATSGFEKFGKYLLLTKIGTGGMAEVFLGRPTSADGNGFVVALKRVLPHVAADENFINMFRAELQVCMGFSHPNIVKIQDFGEENGQPYIAMDFIDGVNLRTLIAKLAKNGEFVPVEMAVSLTAQAAAGLNYSHDFENPVTGQKLKVVHRDISPQNLILSYDGNLKIIDFGIAKATSKAEDSTNSGILKGKVAYMSPEQIEGTIVGPRSDLFSLGIVCWEMLTGRRLFTRPGDSDITVLDRIRNCDDTVIPPSQLNPKISEELDQIVMRALMSNPDDRYPSAAEFQKALTGFLKARYPAYSYGEVGKTVRGIFEKELTESRKSLRELNDKAQENLVLAGMERPPRLEMPPAPVPSTRTNTGLTPKPIMMPPAPVAAMAPPRSPQAAVAEASREVMFKRFGNRRVGLGHIVMFLIYATSMVGLKLQEHYQILERFMLPTEVVSAAVKQQKEVDAAVAKTIVRKIATEQSQASIPVKKGKRAGY